MVLITEIYGAENLANKSLTFTDETHFVIGPANYGPITLIGNQIRFVIPTDGFLRIEAI